MGVAFLDPRWILLVAPFAVSASIVLWLCRRAPILGLMIVPSPALADAWEELNAQRANVGLPPMVMDSECMDFAQAKAEWQASRHVSGFVPWGRDGYRTRLDARRRPYNGHEGPRLPGRNVEGTGCSRNPGPFVTCAWDAVGANLRAGAGLAIGSDGHRYMVIVIRAQDVQTLDSRRPIINTSHLTPDPVRVPFVGRIPAESNGPHVPITYSFGDDPPPSGKIRRAKRAQLCPRCGRSH